MYGHTKGADVPVHRIKAYRRNRGTTPYILNIGTIRKSVISFMFRPLYSQVPIGQDAGSALEPVWTLSLPGIEFRTVKPTA